MKLIAHKADWNTYNHQLTNTEFYSYELFLLTDDDKMVCKVSADVMKDKPTEAVFHGLYTTEEYRNKKWGRRLMVMMEEEMERNGVEIITLSCDDNSYQQKFYEKLDYRYLSYNKGVLVWMIKSIKND